MNLKQLLLLGGLFLAILLMWQAPILSWIIYPIKIFVVLLHEISHGLAAVISGGRIVKIELSHLQGGVCWSAGGLRMLVLPAGYLGSMLWGGIILLVAAKTEKDKLISIILGGLVVLITLLYVRNLFGFIFGVFFGALLILLGVLLPKKINDAILKFIGLTSILYAVLDIGSDLIFRKISGSDAEEMARLTMIPGFIWGIIWIALAILAAIFFLKIAVTEKTEHKMPES